MTTSNDYKIADAGLECIAQIVSLAASSGLSFWSIQDYRAEISRGDTIFRICSDGSGELVGFIIGRKVPSATDEGRYDAEIYNIAVEREFRRKGVGSAILMDFLRVCALEEVKIVSLEVRTGNAAAIEFYKRSGFSEIALRRAFYSDPAEDAILMNRIV